MLDFLDKISFGPFIDSMLSQTFGGDLTLGKCWLVGVTLCLIGLVVCGCLYKRRQSRSNGRHIGVHDTTK